MTVSVGCRSFLQPAFWSLLLAVIKRLAVEHPNHVWSWNFIFDRTASGKQLKWLVVIDEFTRENLCLDVGYGFKSEDVIEQLVAISATRGLPKFIRSDNGPEFIAGPLREWLDDLDVGTLYIEPASPWQNGFAESFNSRFGDEFLALEGFDDLAFRVVSITESGRMSNSIRQFENFFKLLRLC